MSNQINEDWRNELITKGAAFDALTEIENQYEFEDGHDHLMRWAKTKVFALPPAQPQDIARDIATIIENDKDMRVILDHQWIPCSERLPKKRDWYLGIFKEPDTEWINQLPFICDYVGKETKATTKEGWILRGFTDREEHIDYYFNLECVAWMPLSEPWRGEQNGKNS